jgi:hypothetical protein
MRAVISAAPGGRQIKLQMKFTSASVSPRGTPPPRLARAWFVCGLCCACWLCGPPPAAAAQASDPAPEEAPRIRVEIPFEIQEDWSRPTGGNGGATNDLNLKVEPAVSVRIAPQLALEVALVLEPVAELAGRGRYFGDRGLFVEQLYLEYATERFGLRGGKLNPHFGFAWDAAPGIYGVDFAEDYEITERIGAGGFLRLGNGRVGFHRITLDAFFTDTTLLSDSLGTRRGRARRSDGGPGNTGDPRSFTLCLEGEELPRLPGLGYLLGFARQAAGEDGLDETRYAIGLRHDLSLREGVEVELLAEYVFRRNPHGEAADWHDLTLGAAVRWRGWNLSLASSLRRLSAPADLDRLFQVSVGYELPNGLAFDVGWRHARESGAGSSGIGARLQYTFAF